MGINGRKGDMGKGKEYNIRMKRIGKGRLLASTNESVLLIEDA